MKEVAYSKGLTRHNERVVGGVWGCSHLWGCLRMKCGWKFMTLLMLVGFPTNEIMMEDACNVMIVQCMYVGQLVLNL